MSLNSNYDGYRSMSSNPGNDHWLISMIDTFSCDQRLPSSFIWTHWSSSFASSLWVSPTGVSLNPHYGFHILGSCWISIMGSTYGDLVESPVWVSHTGNLLNLHYGFHITGHSPLLDHTLLHTLLLHFSCRTKKRCLQLIGPHKGYRCISVKGSNK